MQKPKRECRESWEVGDTASPSLQVEGGQVALGHSLHLAKDSQGTVAQRRRGASVTVNPAAAS